ncbi:hypothetical protein C2S52_013329 [Perilla frutescens var. hirtella]|nr:hypothetical protein C2S52_013329 [Perilla frutescens var. hirtella]
MDLEIVGRHALLFDDDSSAAFVNSGDALVEWHSLQIDRYDVRHLLSDPPPPRRRNRTYEHRTSDDPSIEFLIDQERYLDLPLESDQPELEEEEKPSSSGGYRSVAFSYGNNDDSTDQKNTDVGMEASGYLPPFSVPGDIVQNLPPTEKVHQIIARTATFVSKHGGQTEIILRVKQGDNPTFGFLMPDHHLHAYFRYLVEHPELLHTEIGDKSQDERKTAGSEHNYPGNVGGALSLLGSVYGSGEEEDGDDASPSHDAKIMDSVETAVKDESISRKPILSNKDKVPAVKKNSSIIGSKPKSVKGIKKEDNSGLFSAAEEKLKNHGIGATSKQILEPPPELKRLIDKLVEFVMRNGKQFEATLLEQDSKLERFSFLLPSNQYHSYYLNALQASQESKVNDKSIYPGQEDQSGRGISKSASFLEENNVSYPTSEFCDVPFESDRKEKFKMVIGKSRKEAQETEKESQESGFTVDAAAAAAILQAATKGIKSSGLQIIRSAATSSHNNVARNEDTIAGTVSHVAAGGADSSVANLTEEQKLKAERLKKAKLFVAMLKSGSLPSRTGTSRGSSAEPIEPGMLKSAGEVSRANQEREGSLAPAVVDKPAAKGNFDEGQSERRSKRKYRSRSIGSEVDEEDSCREGHSSRKYRSKSRRHEDDENENAVKKEGRYFREKRRHSRQSHSTEETKNDGESSEENKDHKHTKSLHSSHHSQREDNVSEGIREEERDEIDDEHHSERTYRSRSKSRSHKEDEEVGNAVEKDRKHRRRRHRSHSSSEESENGEESDEQDTGHQHYKAKYPSRHSQRDDNEREGAYKEERDKEHRKSGSKRSCGSRSRRHEDSSDTQNAVEKEDRYYRRKHSSHSSSEETGGESTGDDMDHQHSKSVHRSSHSKHKDDVHEDIYKEEKDHKRSRKSRRSHHSSSERSPGRYSSQGRKKHCSSHTSHHSRDKHMHKDVRSSKDKESRRQHKHDSSSDDENQPGKELHDARDELEEGEISSKVSHDESKGIPSGDGKRGTSIDVTSSEQRAPSQPSETTEVPDDLRAKIRAMLLATRS